MNVGINNRASTINQIFVGVNNIAKEMSNGWVGDANQKAQPIFQKPTFQLPTFTGNHLVSGDETSGRIICQDTTPSFNESLEAADRLQEVI